LLAYASINVLAGATFPRHGLAVTPGTYSIDVSDDRERDDDAADLAAVDDDPVALRFTVIDRDGDAVHLLCEGEDVLFGCPAISSETWAAALTEVPDRWEIVDLAADHQPYAPDEPVDTDELAEQQFELLTSFVRAGFERAEAMTLVVELLRLEGPCC
jgi:hypothetical protein